MARSEKIYRRSPWALLPLLFFVMGFAVFMGNTAIRTGGVLPWIVALFCGAITLFVLARIFVLFKKSNWVLRFTPTHLDINCSGLGRADGAIVSIPWHEITSFRRVSEYRNVASGDSAEGVSEHHLYLELAVSGIDTQPLRAAGVPIYVTDANTFRIAWKDHTTRISPSLDSLINSLPPQIARECDGMSTWEPASSLGEKSFEARIRQLCQGDDYHAAVALMRERYSLTYAQATERISKILSMKVEEEIPHDDSETQRIELAPQGRWQDRISWWAPIALVFTVAWALITSVDAVRSIIVLATADTYVHETFRIDKLYYSGSKGSLVWQLKGYVRGQPEIYAAMENSGQRQPTERELKQRFPPGTQIDVWYNPDAIVSQLQSRSLRVLPFTANLRVPEIDRLIWWLTRGLLPLLLTLILLRYDKRHKQAVEQSRRLPSTAPPRYDAVKAQPQTTPPGFVGERGKRWPVALSVVVIAGVVLWRISAHSDMMHIYFSQQDFEQRQQGNGYVIVGRFSNIGWPAVSTGAGSGEGGIEFVTPEGQKHIYEGFSGKMKALTLRQGLLPDSQFVLLLNQKVPPEQRTDAAPARLPFGASAP